MFKIKTLFGLSILILSLTFVGYSGADIGEFAKIDVKVGMGKEATSGKMVSVHYTGWHLDRVSRG